MTTPSEESAGHFVNNILPLYQGPSVKIRLQPSNKEYVVSKPLLCAESSVFSKMFNREFLESQQQTATLEETEDDVSVRSLEALFQWLYRRTVEFEIEDPTNHIPAALELARLADKYEITGLENTIAQCIEDIIISTPHPKNSATSSRRAFNTHTYYLRRDHIASASILHQGHPVRTVLAAASVEGFLRTETPKFSEEIQAYPSFGADVLLEIRRTLHSGMTQTFTFEDPISGKKLKALRET
ncbi:hypothetical protein N7481_009084 [Penicillium waksmanii]|uniref:uncharacterized protein n=1 Tax=Penicillium waksmanii TaxID=69791 RepID=UPI0025473A6A|nr:uncharacterized protein N7481_009084 [Penicillium waksmanii]KAJ5975377.1 hypothetical protein N7481_009084 [Penicillium waksmanii]